MRMSGGPRAHRQACGSSAGGRTSLASDRNTREDERYTGIFAQLKGDQFPKFFGLICIGPYRPIHDGRVALKWLVIAERAKSHIQERLNFNVSPAVEPFPTWGAAKGSLAELPDFRIRKVGRVRDRQLDVW